MVNSIADNHAPALFDEIPPRSAMPWVGFGFVFAIAFFIFEFLLLLLNIDDESFNFVFILIMLAGSIYWLFCIHRFHKILSEMSRNQYPIAPNEVVLKHFLPLYNFYWLFRWPSSFSEYLNKRGRVKMVPGALIGLLLLTSVVLRYLDGAVALGIMFGIGMYLSAKLRRHVEIVKGVTPDMLPPLPDKSLFGYAQDEKKMNAQVNPPGSMRQDECR